MFKLCDQGFDVEFENGLVACVRWGVGYSDGVTAVDCYVWSRASGCCVGMAEKLPSNEVIRFLNDVVDANANNQDFRTTDMG
jgi:hypothetical protein